MSDDRLSVNVQDALSGLDKLDSRMQRKGVRQAVRAMAKPTLLVAQTAAPKGPTGQLEANVKLRSAGVRRGVFSAVVGIGKKWFTGSAFYGAFVAFGHRIGKRELGNERKLVPANDWIEHAYDMTKGSAVGIFKDAITGFIEENQ